MAHKWHHRKIVNICLIFWSRIQHAYEKPSVRIILVRVMQWRQHGWVVKASDLKSRGRRFKYCSDHLARVVSLVDLSSNPRPLKYLLYFLFLCGGLWWCNLFLETVCNATVLMANQVIITASLVNWPFQSSLVILCQNESKSRAKRTGK